MTSQLSDDVLADKVLATIKNISEQNPDVPTLTDEEIKALRPVALFIISARSLLSIVKYIIKFLKWAGWVLIIAWYLKNGGSINDIISAIGHI